MNPLHTPEAPPARGTRQSGRHGMTALLHLFLWLGLSAACAALAAIAAGLA